MTIYTIYIDVFFLTNLITDLIILFATSVILRRKVSVLRHIFGGSVLALYSLCLLIPNAYIFCAAIGRIAFTVLFTAVFYRCRSIRDLMRALSVFFGVSVIIGGTAWFLAYQTRGAVIGGAAYINVDLKILGSALVLSIFLIKILTSVFERNFSRAKIIVEAFLVADGRVHRPKILIDTGCELKEPISGKPVVLVSSNDEAYEATNGRVVCFKTASGMSSVSVVRPSRIETMSDEYELRDCYVGFTRKKFSDDGLYDAVAPPDAFRKITKPNKPNKQTIRRNTNAKANLKASLKAYLSPAYTFMCRKSVLHRRKRGTAAAAHSRGGAASNPTPEKRGYDEVSQAHTHREKSSSCGIYREKV